MGKSYRYAYFYPLFGVQSFSHWRHSVTLMSFRNTYVFFLFWRLQAHCNGGPLFRWFWVWSRMSEDMGCRLIIPPQQIQGVDLDMWHVRISSVFTTMCIGVHVYMEKSINKRNTHVHLGLHTYSICPKTKMQAVKGISPDTPHNSASQKFLFWYPVTQ